MNDISDLSVSQEAFIAEALTGLRGSTGIAGTIRRSKIDGTDLGVALEVAGRTLQYTCELKPRIDRFLVLDDLKARLPAKRATLLISGPLTDAMASRCRELDIQFIDTAGNAYVTDGEGILINVSGRKLEKGPLMAAREMTITPAAVRMMFALLADPAMLNAPYRNISASVGVAIGAIGKIFDTLETRGFIATAPGGKRIITSPELMLSEWATGYLSRLRPKLKTFRFTSADPAQLMHWTPGLRVSAWGGEVAAQLLTKHLNPATFTIYLDMEKEARELSDLVQHYRLRADRHGEIEVVQPFWNMEHFSDSFPSVPAHLVYADLLGTQEPRNLAVAGHIARQVVQHVHDSQR